MSLIGWLISPSRAGKQADNKEETEEQEKPEAAILDPGSEDERDDNIFVKDSEDNFSSAAFGKRPRSSTESPTSEAIYQKKLRENSPDTSSRMEAGMSENDYSGNPLWLTKLSSQIEGLKSSLSEQVNQVNSKVESVLKVVEDIKEFKEVVTNRIKKLEKSAQFISSKHEELTHEQSTMQQCLNTISNENEALKRQVKTLQVQIEDQQQYSRRNCILIHGIPENESEDTDKLVMDVFTDRLGIILGIQDIDRSHRLGPSVRVLAPRTDQDTVKVRPIIVKFVSYRVRQLVMKSRRNLKGSKMSITEFLIKSRQSLLKEVQQKVGLKNAWSADGKIFAKRGDNIIKINESSDIGVKL